MESGRPHADVDIHAIYGAPVEGISGSFTQMLHGYTVEIRTATPTEVRNKIAARPAWAHSWVRAEHLWGDPAVTKALVRFAQQTLDQYRPDPQEAHSTLHWIESARRKVAEAWQAGNEAYTSFLIATNTWELLCGLWLANTSPIPASKLAYLLTPTLPRLPANFAGSYDLLWRGDAASRVQAYIGLSEWVCAELHSR